MSEWKGKNLCVRNLYTLQNSLTCCALQARVILSRESIKRDRQCRNLWISEWRNYKASIGFIVGTGQVNLICSICNKEWLAVYMHVCLHNTGGTRWLSSPRHCATSRKVTGVFHWHDPTAHTGVDSGSNRNEYQEYFLGGKDGRCIALTTLPPSCADCLEIWVNRPTGTVRACPGL